MRTPSIAAIGHPQAYQYQRRLMWPTRSGTSSFSCHRQTTQFKFPTSSVLLATLYTILPYSSHYLLTPARTALKFHIHEPFTPPTPFLDSHAGPVAHHSRVRTDILKTPKAPIRRVQPRARLCFRKLWVHAVYLRVLQFWNAGKRYHYVLPAPFAIHPLP